MIHHSICLRALGGKPSQLLRACGSRSSAAVTSGGSSRSSTWSEIVHQPLDFTGTANEQTHAAWEVPDINAEVAEFKARVVDPGKSVLCILQIKQ